ncbi:hypothetical protein, variant, partial [Sphaeroforma arctica JP610]
MTNAQMSDHLRLACNSFSGIIQLVSPNDNAELLHQHVAKSIASHYGANYLHLDRMDFRGQVGDDWAEMHSQGPPPESVRMHGPLKDMREINFQVISLSGDDGPSMAPEKPDRFDEILSSVRNVLMKAPRPVPSAENVMESPVVKPTVIYFDGYQDIVNISERRFRKLNAFISKLRQESFSPVII